MTERYGLGSDAALETALLDLGTALAWPETPDLASALGSRLVMPGAIVSTAAETGTGATPDSIRSVIRRRPVRRAILLAAALALVLVGAAVAVQLGLNLLQIEIGPVPSASPSSTGDPSASTADESPPGGSNVPGARLGLGGTTTLDEARSNAGFGLRVPTLLGDPDQVFVGGPGLRGQVAFVYAARSDLPASTSLEGAGLLLTQSRGQPDEGLARKLVDTGLATIAAVSVDGDPGYWISGEPHIFWYLAPDGEVIQESRRMVGDTLVWERDGILYRIEGEIGRERALEIAASIR